MIAALWSFATGCTAGNTGTSSVGNLNGSGTGGQEMPSSSNTETTADTLLVPEFTKFAFELKNTEYALQVREQGGDWQDITPYKVRINPNLTQNIQITDPVKESPMIYFGMGSKAVDVRIQWKQGTITSAKVHPESYEIPARVENDEAVVSLDKPVNICVEINGDRYEMVYIFANPADASMPEQSDGSVKVIQPGLTNCPKVGTAVWDGGIRDVQIYDRVLSADERAALKNGGTASGYTHRWTMESDMKDERNPDDSLSVVGSPAVQKDYQGAAGALVMNGYEDCVGTGALINMGESFTLSVWAYLTPGKEGAERTLLNYFLFVRSDGTIGSNIGDWQFPYVSTNTFTAGAWHHVLLTKQGNDVTVYLDGESGGTQTRPEQDNGLYVTVGSSNVINGMYIRDNETLYLKPGAVLRGTVLFYGSKNAAVKGSGVIDITPSFGVTAYSGIVCAFSQNVTIEGVIVNNPSSFNLALGQSKDVSVKNFKCFSSYGASDGINTKACENVTVDDCFVRSNDDAISIYATSVCYLGSTRNYTLKNTTLIADVAHNINIGIHGQEYGTDEVTNVTVDNIDVVDSKCNGAEYQGVLSMNAGNDVRVHDISFNNIRVQDIRKNQLFNLRVCYNSSYNKVPGKCVENIRFSNITYRGTGILPSVLRGYDAERTVRNITFDNVQINGSKLRENDGYLTVHDFVSNIVIR